MFFGGDDLPKSIPQEAIDQALKVANDPEFLNFVKAALPGAIARTNGVIDMQDAVTIAREAMMVGMTALALTRNNIEHTKAKCAEYTAKARAKNEN